MFSYPEEIISILYILFQRIEKGNTVYEVSITLFQN